MVCWKSRSAKVKNGTGSGDPFWRVQSLVALFVLALGGLLISRPALCRGELSPAHGAEFRDLFADHLFRLWRLYGSSISLPALLQTLFGYDAPQSGLVLSPAGIFSLVTLPIVGYLLGRQMDARYLIAFGLKWRRVPIGCRS